jgi:hypothetical protein
MKDMVRILAIVGFVIALIVGFFVWFIPFGNNNWWGTPKYDLTTDVKFSEGVDAEWAYVQNQREFNVDSTIYMRLKIIAKSNINVGEATPISLVVTIPLISNYTATLTKNNQQVDPEHDYLNNTTTYRFTVYAFYSKDDLHEIIFRFEPHLAGTITVTYIYDDLVLPNEDGYENIYVLE